MWNRRSVLAVAATSLVAGCSTATRFTDDGPDTGDEGGTTTASPTGGDDDSETTGGDSASRDGVPVHASDETTGYDIDLAGAPIVGHADAALDLYYWGDYQCPFCGRFEADTLPRLLDAEVADGTVRLPLLAFPNIGDASLTAAAYSRCVWKTVRGDDPSAFYRWHAAVFDEQGQPNSGWVTQDALHDIANDTDGVDAAAVASCFDDDRSAMEQQTREEKQMGQSHDVSVTPTFVVYNPDTDESARIKGAQPYERFQSTIESIR